MQKTSKMSCLLIYHLLLYKYHSQMTHIVFIKDVDDFLMVLSQPQTSKFNPVIKVWCKVYQACLFKPCNRVVISSHYFITFVSTILCDSQRQILDSNNKFLLRKECSPTWCFYLFFIIKQAHNKIIMSKFMVKTFCSTINFLYLSFPLWNIKSTWLLENSGVNQALSGLFNICQSFSLSFFF